MHYFAAALGCAVVVASCGDAPSRDAIAGERSFVSAADTIDIGQLELDAVPVARVHTVVQIGDGAHSPLAFGRLVDVIMAPDRRVYAADQLTHQVYAFDSTGAHLATFGGPGDGPGEFRRPTRLTVLHDTLLVLDDHGISRFRTDGRFVDRAALRISPPELAAVIPERLAASAGAPVLVIRKGQANQAASYRDTALLVAVDLRDGTTSEPLAVMEGPEIRTIGLIHMADGFGPRRHYAISGTGGLFVASSDGRSIERRSRGSEHSVRILFSAEPKPVTRSDRARLIAATSRSIRSKAPPSERQSLLAATEQMQFAAFHPTVGRLVAGDSDRVLVERPDLSEGTENLPGETTWDLIEGTRVTSRVVLPSRFSPASLVGRHLVGVEVDDLDMQRVVIMSLHVDE